MVKVPAYLVSHGQGLFLPNKTFMNELKQFTTPWKELMRLEEDVWRITPNYLRNNRSPQRASFAKSKFALYILFIEHGAELDFSDVTTIKSLGQKALMFAIDGK